jgi:hypothetical protein
MIDLKLLTLPFKEDEIEWRIAQCGKKGNGQIWATCLAYVSARAIMNRLDDVCGPENWKVGYYFPSADTVICQLSIDVGDDRWLTKEDGAEQTEIESFKGGLSSALKRAGSVWGIGRYLYQLDTGFARIVEARGSESKWGKTKEGAEFFWEPPKLPQWALPVGETADTNGLHPEQPPAGTGIQRDGYQLPVLSKELCDLLGANPSRKLLEDVPFAQLEIIALYTEDRHGDMKDMTEKQRDFYNRVCARLEELMGQIRE